MGESVRSWIAKSIFFKPETELTSSQKWVLGLINLASVVIFWVMSSFLVSDLFESDIYRKPFLITYINTACFSFYLIPYLSYEKMSLMEFIRLVKREYRDSKYKKLPTDSEIGNYGSRSGSEDLIEGGVESEHETDLNIGVLETISLSLQFCALWFSANLVTNGSLSYTSVASQTILSSTSSFFTLLIGFLYSIESINKYKIYGIVLCFIGVLIVTKTDSSSTNPTNSNAIIFFGNMLALSGALIYGIYTILLKVKTIIRNSTLERQLNTHLFFAFVGLFCLFSLWPIIIILHITKIETFGLPSDSHILSLLLLNTLITFISDFCWCKAVILTSPLTVTVGLSMTIPLAMVGDWLLKGFSLNWVYISGAVIVTIGFLIINNNERDEFTHEHEHGN